MSIPSNASWKIKRKMVSCSLRYTLGFCNENKLICCKLCYLSWEILARLSHTAYQGTLATGFKTKPGCFLLILLMSLEISGEKTATHFPSLESGKYCTLQFPSYGKWAHFVLVVGLFVFYLFSLFVFDFFFFFVIISKVPARQISLRQEILALTKTQQGFCAFLPRLTYLLPSLPRLSGLFRQACFPFRLSE